MTNCPSGQGEALQVCPLCLPPHDAQPAGLFSEVCGSLSGHPLGTCSGEALTSHPANLPLGPAAAWLSHIHSSCDLYPGTLEGSFIDFIGDKKQVQWGSRGLLPPLSLPLPPLLLPPRLFSTSPQHLCRLLPAWLSLEPMMTGTGYEALFQRGSLRVWPRLLGPAPSLASVLWCQKALSGPGD